MKVGKIVLRISQIKINISEFYHTNKQEIDRFTWKEIYGKQEESLIRKKAEKLFRCKENEIEKISIVKRSIDARKKQEIYYNYCVDIQLKGELEKKVLLKDKKKRFKKAEEIVYQPPKMGEQKQNYRPVVIGFGPAGMFCALELAKAGYCPIVLERGKMVEQRMEDVCQFWEQGILKPDSNVQFGEGGAGTFSDGKLNTTVKDPSGRNRKVLEVFVEHGAEKEILYLQKPHIGTDALCNIVKNIRLDIEKHGGGVRFGSKVTNFRTDEQEKLCAIEINGQEWLDTEVAVLAIGHSARDTFQVLHDKGMYMEKKPFAIGVRVEHKQSDIDTNQYGELAGILPAADYKLTYQAENGRNVFSFCMCPGGFVVNAASECESLVVNGMSNHDRSEANANSALVVNVVPEDFPSEDVLAGVEFQRKWEKLAYKEGNGKVPVQLFEDFKKNKKSEAFNRIVPIHKGSVALGNLKNCLPDFVCETLEEGIEQFGKRIKGFAEPDVILSGVETRTSSPVRIKRNDDLEGSIQGVYPCGEGAGYAGGITSAAMDGLRVYEAIRKKYCPIQMR